MTPARNFLERRPRRRGAVLIVVMICLTVAMTLIVSWLRIAALERRAAREQQFRLQAQWLAESAIDRAVARLNADETYAGETWAVLPEELAGIAAGEAVIRVEPIADLPQRRTVRVQADYPAHSEHRHRCSKSVDVVLTSSRGSL